MDVFEYFKSLPIQDLIKIEEKIKELEKQDKKEN